jgi:hypothetical protein
VTMRMRNQDRTPRRAFRALCPILCSIFFVALFSGVLSAQPVITTTTLPNGVVGQQYPPQILTAVGGLPAYSWSVTSGSFPPGLALSKEGFITGYPAAAGDFFFIVTVQDSFPTPQTSPRSLEISISPQLSITAAPILPMGVAGAFYSLQIQAAGPTLINWSVVSGNPPPGLTLTTAGLLVGTPTGSGVYQFTAQAATFGPAQTVTQAFTITINRSLNIMTPAVLPSATLGDPYSLSLQVSGGLPPYTWTNVGGPLPAGLTLSADGTLKGTPTGLGSFVISLQVADNFTPANQVSRNFALAVTKPLVITTLSLPNGIQSADYNQQLQSLGGTAPLTWLVTSGTLPAGLILTTDGLLQGKPTTVGAQNLTVTLTDSLGMTVSSTFGLTIDPPLSALTVPSFPSVLNPRDLFGVQLTLLQSHPSPLSGQLSLSFTSSAEVPTDDPMTQFSTGSRVVTFTIPANTTAAVFSSPIVLLTGTVAGVVSLTASFDNGPSNILVASAPIAASAPQITNVAASRTSGGLNLQITGYSTSRRVTSVEFDFDVKSGNTTQRVTLQSNVDAEFSAWYLNKASTAFGSAFSFVQTFTVQGDTSLIETVTVRLANAQGSTSSSPTALQ